MGRKKISGLSSEDSVDDLFSEIAEQTGGDILDRIDSINYFVDTGSLALNYICSGKFIDGGIPGGKLTEIYGPSSSAKSLFGNNILFGCQKMGGISILLDCENSANKEFIKKASHCDLAKVLRYTPQSLEEVFQKMYSVIEKIRKKDSKRPIVIVYDSIGVSPSARELREVDLPENYDKATYKRIVGGNEQPGERAKICSRELRKLNSVMEKTGATVVILNQTREKIGVMFGNPETTAGGGNALPFYASCRIRPQTQKKIEKKITAKKNKILGVNIKLKNVKNKTHKPFIESEGVQLLFDKGINPLSGLLSCLMEDERIEAKGSGNFIIKEKYLGDDKEDNKFKASLDRNEMLLEVLLNNPALINAENREQVENYFAPYMDAINFEISGDIVEVESSEDDDDLIDAEISG
jgi:recombination protein RecA